MAYERLPMRKIKEVLRLKHEGHAQRAIARSCGVGQSTVVHCQARGGGSELAAAAVAGRRGA